MQIFEFLMKLVELKEHSVARFDGRPLMLSWAYSTAV
jgi:hypothetical protein